MADHIDRLVVEHYRTGRIDLGTNEVALRGAASMSNLLGQTGSETQSLLDRDAKVVGTRMNQVQDQQRTTAQRFGAEPVPVDSNLKVGIARNVRTEPQPLNALRHRSEGDTSGWYIWAGEDLSDDPDFFVPLHVTHLAEWCPQIIPYLALPWGWRVLLAPGYEDVWFDEALL